MLQFEHTPDIKQEKNRISDERIIEERAAFLSRLGIIETEMLQEATDKGLGDMPVAVREKIKEIKAKIPSEADKWTDPDIWNAHREKRMQALEKKHLKELEDFESEI